MQAVQEIKSLMRAHIDFMTNVECALAGKRFFCDTDVSWCMHFICLLSSLWACVFKQKASNCEIATMIILNNNNTKNNIAIMIISKN